MLHLFDKYVNDDKTKAIFEHFRNLLTSGAVMAMGQWLARRLVGAKIDDFLVTLGGSILVMVGIALLLLAVLNAQAKMKKAGFDRKSLAALWAVHSFLVVYGIFAHSMLH
jgi:uncharacterized membrane protein YidH (DUF202 family)